MLPHREISASLRGGKIFDDPPEDIGRAFGKPALFEIGARNYHRIGIFQGLGFYFDFHNGFNYCRITHEKPKETPISEQTYQMLLGFDREISRGYQNVLHSELLAFFKTAVYGTSS